MLPRLVSLVAPPLCGTCGTGCAPEAPVCEGCAAAIAASPAQPFTVPGADSALAAAPYEGVPRRLVSALKFGRRLPLAGVAAEAIARRAGAIDGTIVPCPPDPWRLRLRGFDPAAEIAAALARRLDLPLSHCLVRRHAPRQTGKTRSARLAARHSVRAAGTVPSQAVLVDDVTTTGTTLGECATALRAAGTVDLLALTFARA